MASPFDQATVVYSLLNFKGKSHHLSQLGTLQLHPSVLSIRPGRGCHLHVTSVYYPNVLVLCIQMEAFILPLLGLHPSNAHLTGIQMFPPTTVSDSVFGALISEVGRSLSALPNRLLALQGKGVCQQGLSDCLVAMSEACRSHNLQYYLLNRSACCRVVVQPGGKSCLVQQLFPNCK